MKLPPVSAAHEGGGVETASALTTMVTITRQNLGLLMCSFRYVPALVVLVSEQERMLDGARGPSRLKIYSAASPERLLHDRAESMSFPGGEKRL